MSKETSPAFQFYAAEYLADENVQLMSMAEEGCYIHLMAVCWREGSIPSDVDKLARLCKGTEPSELVLSCFSRVVENGCRLVHKRLDEERVKQQRWKEKSELGGKRSAHKRKHLRNIDTEQGGSTTVPRVVQPKGNSSSSSSSSNTPIVPKGDESAQLFKTFWEKYPRKIAKHDAFKAWQKIHADRALLDKILDAINRQNQALEWTRDGGRFIPYPATWLNARRWEDEVQQSLPSTGNGSAPVIRMEDVEIITMPDGRQVARPRKAEAK